MLKAVLVNTKDDGEEAACSLDKSLIYTLTMKIPIKKFQEALVAGASEMDLNVLATRIRFEI